MAAHCPKLTTFTALLCSAITHQSLQLVAQRCVGLRELDLRVLDKLTDEGLQEISRAARRLTRLGTCLCWRRGVFGTRPRY